MLNIAATVFNVIFLVIFFLFILINVLRGLSKGIVATAVRTVFIFISGLLAIFIAVPIGKVVSKTAVGFINGLIISGFPEFTIGEHNNTFIHGKVFRREFLIEHELFFDENGKNGNCLPRYVKLDSLSPGLS